jgi:MULE transposase domain
MGRKGYLGKWRADIHSHICPISPFEFLVHLAATEEYQQLRSNALLYRFTNQPFSAASKLLDADSFGIKIKQKDYYNLLRHKMPDKDDLATVAGLIQALQEEGLNIRYRARQNLDKDNPGQIVSQTLTNIFFWSSGIVEFVRRWCAGAVLQMDATFNTNRDRLPLLVAVGVTNEGITFPVAFAFIKGETTDAFDFFFECLRAEIFCDGVLDPAVILADQAAGLMSAIANGCMPCRSYHYKAAQVKTLCRR